MLPKLPAIATAHVAWAGAAASLVYGREQLHSRNDPWLQMLALQASGYGRDEEEVVGDVDRVSTAIGVARAALLRARLLAFWA